MISLVLSVLIITVILLMLICGSWYIWTLKYSFIDQPLAIPWFGASLSIPSNPHKLFLMIKELAVKSNHLYLLWFGPLPIIVCSRVDYAEAVLSSPTLIRKSYLYHFLHGWLGTGLLTSYGGKWKKRRRVITPSYHFSILNEFTRIFDEQANRLVDKLKLLAKKGEPIDIQVPVSLATLDVICETSMGVKVNAQDSSTSEYVNAVLSMSTHVQWRQRCPWLWPHIIYKCSPSGKDYYKKLNVVHSFTINVINAAIERRKKERSLVDEEKSSSKKKVFIDMLLDLYDKGEIDIEGIREEVDTFMFEGHDTTASGLSWALYLLGKHPEIQDKLYREIKGVFTDSSNILEKVKSIKYLDYVMKEALRLHPPVPLFGRTIEKDVIIDSNLIPKGTQIIVNPYNLHRNPLYWEDPDTFNPDRFGNESFLKRNPYCYVPFSAGPRNCIGQKFAMLEEKILVYYVIANFKLSAVQPEEDIRGCMELIHKSENGLRIEFLSR